MGKFLESELKALGAHVEARPLGKQPGKEYLELPPVIVARYGEDPKKRTILVYGHYDVQPALKEDGWLLNRSSSLSTTRVACTDVAAPTTKVPFLAGSTPSKLIKRPVSTFLSTC